MKGQRSWCSGIGTRLKVGVLNLSEILNRVKQKKKRKKKEERIMVMVIHVYLLNVEVPTPMLCLTTSSCFDKFSKIKWTPLALFSYIFSSREIIYKKKSFWKNIIHKVVSVFSLLRKQNCSDTIISLTVCSIQWLPQPWRHGTKSSSSGQRSPRRNSRPVPVLHEATQH